MKQLNLRQLSAKFLATTPCPMRERVSRLVGTGKGLLFALFMVFGLGVSQEAMAAWLGNAGITVNDTWYKASSEVSADWLKSKSTINNANLGICTSLVLGGQFDTYDDAKTDECSWNGNIGIWIKITTSGGTEKSSYRLSCYHDSKSGNNNIWKSTGTKGTCGDKSAYGTYTENLSGLSAGSYKLKVHWFSPSGVSLPSSGDDVATFTIPGFTKTSTSKDYGNVAINSETSSTISFGTHYGTALTTSNCSITGDGASSYSVTAISESGVTVKFKPTSAGSKSATLTITDAHSKTCTITLSGTVPTNTLTWDLAGGTAGTGTITGSPCAYGTVLQYTKNPTKTYYDFDKWNPTMTSGTTTMPAEEATYTAQWKEHMYDVNFIHYYYNIAGIEINAGDYARNPETISDIIGTETGHEFNTTSAGGKVGFSHAKWMLAKNAEVVCNGQTTTLGSDAKTTTISGSTDTSPILNLSRGVSTSGEIITIYDRWKEISRSVVVKAQYGSADSETVETLSALGVYTSKTAAVSSRTGYTIKEWQTAPNTNYVINLAAGSDALHKVVTVSSNESNEASGTITAVFKEDMHTATIAYMCGGSSIQASTTSGQAGIATTTALTAPDITGYTFSSWATLPTGATLKAGDVLTSKTINVNLTADDLTITANYTLNLTYDLKVVAGSHVTTVTGSVDPITLGNSYPIAATAFATGYEFNNWTKKAGAGTATFADSNAASTNVTVTVGSVEVQANAKPITYTITYIGVESSEHNNPSTYNIETPTFNFVTPTGTRTGYTFDKWSPGAINQGSWGHMNVTGSWTEHTYTIAFDGNGATSGSTASISDVKYTDRPTLTANGFAKTGYTFAGWATSAGGDVVYADKAQISSALTADNNVTVTLFAKWTAKQYVVTLDNQGADVKSGDASVTCTYDAAMPTLSVRPEKTGYTFAGYWSGQNGTGTMYINPSGSSAHDWNIDVNSPTLYASWTANTNTPYVVNHFKQNLDGTYPADPFATDNLTGTTGASVTPAVKTGAAITGFSAPTPQTTTVLADGSLVVRYEYTRNSYNLTWDLAGGTAGTGTITASPAKYEQVLYYSVNPSWTGYQFMGWDPAMTSGSTTMPAANTTYKATWQAKTYTVTLNNQGATTAGAASVTATYNAVVPSIAGNLPAKTGFTFDGYYTKENGGGTQIIKADGTSTYVWSTDAGATLHANWVTVHVYLEGRARVKNAEGVETTINPNDEWVQTLKTIPFTFNSTDGVYYLNTYCTVLEQAANVGTGSNYIRMGIANGDDGAVTPYGCNTAEDYIFTPDAKGSVVGATNGGTNNKSFKFRDVETYENDNFKRRYPVMYRYNPTTNKFDYCAPLLTLSYGGNTATMTGYTIAFAQASAIANGLTDAAIVYQYKLNDGDWTTWSSDITAAQGTYKLRAVASGNNEFGQPVTGVVSNEITVTVTTPAVSAQVTHVNGVAGNIIRINDSFTIMHTVTGVPTGQSVQVCYHWKTKPAGSQITKDVFTAVGGDQPNSVWTTIDVAGDYEIEVSVSTQVCQNEGQTGYIKWMTYTLPIHVKGDEIVVYAKIDKGITDWNKKYVYHWKSGQPIPYEWPGQEMTYLGKDSVDYEWYSKSITNYKTYAGGNLLFNDSTKRYGQYQSNNVDMPTDDEFYFIKTAVTGGKRDVATDPHIDVTRRVILTTDTTALYQYVTIELEGKGVFFANREEMKYTYTITGKPDGSGATLNAKNQFTPDKAGDYTVTIRCEAGTLNAENSFVLHVKPNPLTLTASVGATSTIGSSTTVTVSAEQTLQGTKTFTVIEPGSNSPITFSTKSTVATSVISDSYTMLSSGMYIFSVVLTNDGKITGKAQDTVTVAAKKYYIKHPFKNTASVQDADWVWKEMTYNEIDGTYQYKGEDAYFHTDKKANINNTGTDAGGKPEYTIVNPDELKDNTKCLFVYDITTDKVTVYALNKRLYRIKSVCQDNEYYSNAITLNGQDISFFAQKDGQLIWQERATSADPWVDQSVEVTTKASTSGVYTAKPDIKATSFDLTPYTDTLTVFSQVVTVNSAQHSPTALNGKLTEFTKKNSSEYYNHYWVRYVESGTQAMATVGNKINNCIAATLPYYQMPASGNVRFAYDNTTNHFSRTFLSGSGDANFLRVYGQHLDTLRKSTVDTYDAINSLANSKKFDDGSDWIYTAKASGKVSASNSVTAILTTKYNGMNRWVLAESGLEADPAAEQVVLSKDAASAGRYDLTLIYDYKTNRLTAGAQPQPGTEVSDTMVIDQLILTREGDGSATQFTLAEKAKLIVVDRMTVEFDVTKDMYDAWADEGKFPGYKVMYFWFSVPYECNINEIYGLGVYGEKFEIQRYRGDLRAAGSAGSSTGTSAWRKLKATATMEANRGYVIAMRVAASDFKSATVGGETKSIIRLFFPSVGKVELTHNVKTVLAEYENDKTTNLHWNWNIMGCPLVKDGNNLICDSTESAELNYIYVWTWGGGARTYEPWSVDETTLQSTHSYMVQAKGNVYWAYPKTTAPGRYLEAAQFASEDSYGKLNIRLNISKNDKLLDKTYIMYREDGDRDEYEMGRDLEKIVNLGVTQMYAVANNNLAAVCVNSTDKEMIPLTLIANENGEYTFSIHRQLNSNLEPTIYDAQTGKYYNLAMDEFVIDLDKGTYTNRFFFVLKKPGVVTSLDELNSNNYQEGVHKVMRNGQLYIIRDNDVYDATGRFVK